VFDVSFPELAVIAVIALIVLGPERLPTAARTLGRWVGRAKTYMRNLSSELERELSFDEIRSEVRDARERIESETRGTFEALQEPIEPDDPATESDQAHETGTGAAEDELGDPARLDPPTAHSNDGIPSQTGEHEPKDRRE
jgi:sec-independent protein translocase protein TatB